MPYARCTGVTEWAAVVPDVWESPAAGETADQGATVTASDVPDVELGIFCKCLRCRRWWHRRHDGLLRGPLDDVTGGPTMDTPCPLCTDEAKKVK